MMHQKSEQGFPSHLIPPEKKDKDWILCYCKAAWGQYSRGQFRSTYAHRAKYREFTDYAFSNQSVGKYKRMLNVDESGDSTLLSIDWSPLAVFTRMRNLALAITKKLDYDVEATPIDQMAQEQISSYFKKMETKVRLRDALKKVNPELVEQGPLRREADEPEDLDELEIQRKYTYKHLLSIEVEQFLKVVFEHNNMTEVRAQVKADVFDKGIGGVKEYIDKSGAIKIRAVRPEGYVCSPCSKRDHSDSEWQGEIIEMTVSEIIEEAGDVFSPEEYKHMARISNGARDAKPFSSLSGASAEKYDVKIPVLDIEFFSTNAMFFEKSVDKYGNYHFTRTSPKRAAKNPESSTGVNPQVIYKAKWVVGTDYIYDYGIATDMKRRKSMLATTQKSFHMFAPNWDATKLESVGVTEQCITIIDQMNLAWFKLQHAIATARPKGISIEVSALEDVSIGKGGKAMTPRDVIEVYDTSGVLVWRKTGIDGMDRNYRPIEELENGIGRQAEEYFAIIMKNLGFLKEIVGLNEATDSFTGSRVYGAAVEAGLESTNNSLYPVIESDFEVMKSVSNAVLLRVQAITRGKPHPGYVAALGDNTMRFFKAGLDVSAHEFGLILRAKPTAEERARFMLRVDEFVKAGSIDIEDALMIENMQNLKAAGQVLAYKIRKRREEAQRIAMEQQQMNAQVQMQSNQASEAAKQQTLQVEYQLKANLVNLEKEWDFKIAQLQVQGKMMDSQTKAGTSLEVESMKAESKEYQTEVLASARSERNNAQLASDLTK